LKGAGEEYLGDEEKHSLGLGNEEKQGLLVILGWLMVDTLAHLIRAKSL
jgi:hypothetical protein